KEIDEENLVRAIRDVAAGKSILDPAVTRRVLERVKNPDTPSTNKLDSLSPQERRVLALVAEGKTNKEIGGVLGLSDKTVKKYLKPAKNGHAAPRLHANGSVGGGGDHRRRVRLAVSGHDPGLRHRAGGAREPPGHTDSPGENGNHPALHLGPDQYRGIYSPHLHGRVLPGGVANQSRRHLSGDSDDQRRAPSAQHG